MKFKKIVIWGHTNTFHTHYWIHFAFNRAFKYMKYDTIWLSDQPLSPNELEITENTLFITEGQCDKYIPINKKCYYILHNCKNKYKNNIPNNQIILLQVYTNPALAKIYNPIKYDNFMYYNFDNLDKRICYMPWATDILPNEINNIIQNIDSIINLQKNNAKFIGSVWGGEFGNIPQINKYKNECRKNNIPFHNYSGINMQQNIKLIQESKYSPTIVGEWQQIRGYIPCRAFKNISYGGYCITNSKEVYEIFEKKVCYDPDCSKLFYKGKEYINQMTKEKIIDLMNIVKNKHTYINRIQFLLNGFDLNL